MIMVNAVGGMTMAAGVREDIARVAHVVERITMVMDGVMGSVTGGFSRQGGFNNGRGGGSCS